MEAALTKMRIMPFTDSSFTTPAGPPYVAQVNPETYTIKYANEYAKTQEPDTSAGDPAFNKQPPEELSFDFIFDSTGVLEPPLVSSQQISKELGVEPDLIAFRKFLLEIKGQTHRPPCLILNWGTLLFKCVLISMNINYKLFCPGGIPVRAVVNCTFRRVADDLLRMAMENMSSPDLTHARVVKAGDTLPGLCQEIYGNPGFYTEVAAANELTNVMELIPGTQLFFPPIEKANA